MYTRPEFTSSRPASIRSEVDFPQPDGPTNTRNSPSAIASDSSFTAGSVDPGYVRGVRSNVTVAIENPLLFPVTGHPARVIDNPCGSRQLHNRSHTHVGAGGAESKLQQPWLHQLITVA